MEYCKITHKNIPSFLRITAFSESQADNRLKLSYPVPGEPLLLHKFLKSMCLYYNIPVPSLQRKIYPSEKDMTFVIRRW